MNVKFNNKLNLILIDMELIIIIGIIGLILNGQIFKM